MPVSPSWIALLARRRNPGFDSPSKRLLQPPRASPPRSPSRRCNLRTKPTSCVWIAQFAQARIPLEDGTVFSRTSFRRDHRAQLVTRCCAPRWLQTPRTFRLVGLCSPSRLLTLSVAQGCRPWISTPLASTDGSARAPPGLYPLRQIPRGAGDRLRNRHRETRVPSASYRPAPSRALAADHLTPYRGEWDERLTPFRRPWPCRLVETTCRRWLLLSPLEGFRLSLSGAPFRA